MLRVHLGTKVGVSIRRESSPETTHKKNINNNIDEFPDFSTTIKLPRENKWLLVTGGKRP